MLRRRRRFRRTAATAEELNQAIIEKENASENYSSSSIRIVQKIAKLVAGSGSDLRAVADDEEAAWDYIDLDSLSGVKEVLRKAATAINTAYDLMENAVEARHDMFELEEELLELKKVRRPEAEDYLKLTEGVVRRRTRRQGG